MQDREVCEIRFCGIRWSRTARSTGTRVDHNDFINRPSLASTLVTSECRSATSEGSVIGGRSKAALVISRRPLQSVTWHWPRPPGRRRRRRRHWL